jgi:putative FmdB family regulatory protein
MTPRDDDGGRGVPTYEYRCKACDQELETVQAFTDDALTTCPACGAEELRKVFGAVGISFKGSGFYKTDSRGSSTATSTSSGSSTSGGDGGSGGGSSSSPSESSSSSTSGSTSTESASKPAASPKSA